MVDVGAECLRIPSSAGVAKRVRELRVAPNDAKLTLRYSVRPRTRQPAALTFPRPRLYFTTTRLDNIKETPRMVDDFAEPRPLY